MAERFAQYDYDLPTHLIAQHPLPEREHARLMLLRRGQGACAHHRFDALPALLAPGTLLVLNNTRVPPRRLTARLDSGVALEALLVAPEGEAGVWRAKVKKAKRLRPGMRVPFAGGVLMAEALKRTEDGGWHLRFDAPETLAQRLEAHGLAPLPPYIRRDVHGDYDGKADRRAYQTCYARVEGAIAAPTAGLHFTGAVLEALHARGILTAELTLHVGEGTFAKVQVEHPAEHTMHTEWIDVPAATATAIAQARAEGRPVVAVGTTTVRALESWAREGLPLGWQGWSDLYVRPPFDFLAVDGLLTNFHLPRSTLMLLVAAFHGRERLLDAYAEAIREQYRFFSFGDCMLIVPDAALARRA